MAETDHTPKMFAKFIQLMSHGGKVWALDDNGDVWRRQPVSDNNNNMEWRKLTVRRVG